jgi:D-alanine-D-alanine ligase
MKVAVLYVASEGGFGLFGELPARVRETCRLLEEKGHGVAAIPVDEGLETAIVQIRSFAPDVAFNLIDRGRGRESLYPALLAEMRIPTTGPDGVNLAVLGDRALARAVAREQGVPTVRGTLVTAAGLQSFLWTGVRFPAVARPAGDDGGRLAGLGISCRTLSELQEKVRRLLAETDAVILDEALPGVDVVVSYLDGLGDGILPPCELLAGGSISGEGEGSDEASSLSTVRCPAVLPDPLVSLLRNHARRLVRALGMRDYGQMLFRIVPDGVPLFVEATALPSLGPESAFMAAAATRGVGPADLLNRICETAVRRRKSLGGGPAVGKDRKGMRVGFVYNLKRVAPTMDGDHEAEYDPPKTIEAVRGALERMGNSVVMLEANETLPQRLADAQVDVVFNIAEGWRGRTREAQVPALCDMLGIAHTGSDATTLSIAMDKAVTKDLFLRNGVPTPVSQLFRTPKDRLDRAMIFPLIVKPNAEGSSKGIRTNAVVHCDEELRIAVKEALARYQQPVLVEQYVAGREFTVALFQTDAGFKVLPALEVVFLDPTNRFPVYSYEIKQDWDKNVRYDCPARIDRRLERTLAAVSKRAFRSLGCRDYARVDIRMGGPGNLVPYVLEVNPLPGLTPDFSDMCLISNAAGISYDNLIAAVLRYAVRRSRVRRTRSPAAGRVTSQGQDAPVEGNGKANGNGNGSSATVAAENRAVRGSTEQV